MLSIPIVSQFNDKGIKNAIKGFKQLETTGQKASFLLKAGMAAGAAGIAAVGAAACMAARFAACVPATLDGCLMPVSKPCSGP